MSETNTTTTKTRKITATLPDGTVATRKTARNYTHAVAILITAEHQIDSANESIAYYNGLLAELAGRDGAEQWNEYYSKTVDEQRAELRSKIVKAQAKAAAAVDYWQVQNWCGRHDLAVKQADRWSNYPAVQIVEVDA